MQRTKHQTKTQVLLDILLEDAEDDLALSQQRLEILYKQGDKESFTTEKKYHRGVLEKLGHINWLIGYGGGSSNCATKIDVVTLFNNGNDSTDTYVSKIKI